MRIKANIRTKCSCGCWIKIGSTIEWNKETKKTEGCYNCNYSGHPADRLSDALLEASYEAYLSDRDWI